MKLSRRDLTALLPALAAAQSAMAQSGSQSKGKPTLASKAYRFEDLPEERLDPDPAPLADERLIDEQQRDRLFHAIRTLPEAQRQAVMLYLEGLSQREIAELQETSDNNVAVRLTRARKALRTLLVEEER